MDIQKITVGLFILITLLIFSGFTQKQDKDKKAILFVSFGTTFKDNKTITIDALKEKLEKQYKDYDVKLAFTSRQIIKKIYKRDNIKINTPTQALKELKNDGYKTVIVQATHIINGVEAEYLKDEVREVKDDFQTIKLGKPLLTSIEDYKKTSLALKQQTGNLEKDEAVVLIGHGTHHHATSAYAMMNYIYENQGENVYLGTVEGFPSYENVLLRLKKNKIKKITLMPFMFVAGDHANNDIAGNEEDSWKSKLKKEGFEVEVYLHGLGENKDIQNIFIEHIEEAIYKKEESIKRKKASYAIVS